MNMWSYPVGAIVDMGEPLTERTVRGPLPVTINNISYPTTIFSNWSGPELAALGIKLFLEDPIPAHYQCGVPVDVETDYQIHRTYPNAVFDYDNVKSSYIEKINSIRKSKEEFGFVFAPSTTNVWIATDVKGSLRMTQMAFVFQADPTHIEEWKGADPATQEDKWFAMNAQTYSQIVAEGQQYVRDCFLRQQALQEELEALPETPEAYLAFAATIETGWPS